MVRFYFQSAQLSYQLAADPNQSPSHGVRRREKEEETKWKPKKKYTVKRYSIHFVAESWKIQTELAYARYFFM